MDYIKLFNDVENEFSKEEAILTVVAMTLNLTIAPELDDLQEVGRYTERLNAATRETLREYSNELIDEVILIREAYYVFDMRQSLQGLGGCEAKTIKEIMRGINENKNSRYKF